MYKNSTNTLISIVGPTGSGKSDLAVALALGLTEATGTVVPILSTDSRQVYRGMAVGTAQPTEDQLLSVPHYFIADREPTECFTCADFETEALQLLEKLFAETQFVVAVGGSGLYIDALCRGLDELPDVDLEIRKQLTDSILHSGIEPLLHELRQKDPVYFEQVDRQNPARIQRAVEVIRQTGKPFSSFRTGARKLRPFKIVKIGIDLPRQELYRRIDERVDRMVEQGLEAEARALVQYSQLPALQTVGYREMNQYFNNEISLDRAVELIKRNSRRYAKRQMTWFRRDGGIHWIPSPDPAAALEILTLQ